MTDASRKDDVSGKLEGREVAIVGGGIAGLTAALHLARNGFSVTIYEKDETVGGNLGGDLTGTIYQDVYFHMFGDWYHNFWKLTEHLGLSRERDFEPRPTCAFLSAGEFPQYKLLTNNGSIETLAFNLISGILPVPDMFLAGYSVIDLLSQNFSGNSILSQQTVNGFVTSRPYATKRMAKMHDILISNIWAINSYLTSAIAYQQFSKYQLRHPTPQAWVLKGDAYRQLITPLKDKLEQLGCIIHTNMTVRGVTVKGGRVDSISIVPTEEVRSGRELQRSKVENVILAVPPNCLAQLVQTEAAERRSDREDAEPIVSIVPQLSELRRLRSQPLPVFYVTFKRRLPDIPVYYVSLVDSPFELTFVKVPYQSNNEDQTVLAVAVSDLYALPDNIDESNKHAYNNAKYFILRELRRYIPFRLGSGWGDPASDVDWNNSNLHSNKDHALFVNEVGSEKWAPNVFYPEIPNLFFAGDFCNNPVTITTAEAAVVSGLQAAKELGRQRGIDLPIEIIELDSYPENLMAALKVVLAPYAFGAKCWSEAYDAFNTVTRGSGSGRAGASLGGAASAVAENAMRASAAMNECWDAMLSFYGRRGR